MIWLAAAILASACILGVTLFVVAGMFLARLDELDMQEEGRHHMNFAMDAMQLTLEITDREMEVPEWLKQVFEEDEEELEEPERKLRVLPFRKKEPTE